MKTTAGVVSASSRNRCSEVCSSDVRSATRCSNVVANDLRACCASSCDASALFSRRALIHMPAASSSTLVAANRAAPRRKSTRSRSWACRRTQPIAGITIDAASTTHRSTLPPAMRLVTSAASPASRSRHKAASPSAKTLTAEGKAMFTSCENPKSRSAL